MITFHPCIWLDNTLQETCELYAQLLPNGEVVPVNEFIASVKLGDSYLDCMAAGPSFRPNPAMSMYLVCETEEQTRSAWELLSPFGKTLMPLQAYDWGPLYGWLEDRFGVSWQITHGDQGGTPPSVTPALMFTGDEFGRAKEALEIYTTIFPNSEIQLISNYGDDDPIQAGKVAHGKALLNGNRMIAMDSGMDHGDLKFTEGTSLMVTCDTQAEIDHYWEELIKDGGAPSQCGWLKDRFGVSWQIIPHQLGEWMSDGDRAPRVGAVLRTMGKLDLAKLRDA